MPFCKRCNKPKSMTNCPCPQLHQARPQRSLYLFECLIQNLLKPRPPLVRSPSQKMYVLISPPPWSRPRKKTPMLVNNSLQKLCHTHNGLVSDGLAPALFQTPRLSRRRPVTESSDNEDYSQFIPGAYPEEPTQPTTPVLIPLVYKAQFCDLSPPTPAQRPRRLLSLTPCPPGRYPSSSLPRPTQEPLGFDCPSSDFEWD